MPLSNKHHRLPAATLIDQARDARARTIALLDDLNDEQLEVPHLSNVNPPGWELGHIAFFFEVFFLRELGRDTQLLRGADEFFDSFHVAHDTRWSLPLPSREKTIAYMTMSSRRLPNAWGAAKRILRRLISRFFAPFTKTCTARRSPIPARRWNIPRPGWTRPPPRQEKALCPATSRFPAGAISSAHPKTTSFLFDNEKWGHPVEVQAFRIARAPVTNEEFAAFVDDGGYGHTRVLEP